MNELLYVGLNNRDLEEKISRVVLPLTEYDLDAGLKTLSELKDKKVIHYTKNEHGWQYWPIQEVKDIRHIKRSGLTSLAREILLPFIKFGEGVEIMLENSKIMIPLNESHNYKIISYQMGNSPKYYMGNDFFAISIPTEFHSKKDFSKHVLTFWKPNGFD